MNMLARLLAPLNHSGLEKRREELSVAQANELQNERVLRDEIEDQWEIYFQATDPDVRERARDEIDRINVLLRAT